MFIKTHKWVYFGIGWMLAFCIGCGFRDVSNPILKITHRKKLP